MHVTTVRACKMNHNLHKNTQPKACVQASNTAARCFPGSRTLQHRQPASALQPATCAPSPSLRPLRPATAHHGAMCLHAASAPPPGPPVSASRLQPLSMLVAGLALAATCPCKPALASLQPALLSLQPARSSLQPARSSLQPARSSLQPAPCPCRLPQSLSQVV